MPYLRVVSSHPARMEGTEHSVISRERPILRLRVVTLFAMAVWLPASIDHQDASSESGE